SGRVGLLEPLAEFDVQLVVQLLEVEYPDPLVQHVLCRTVVAREGLELFEAPFGLEVAFTDEDEEPEALDDVGLQQRFQLADALEVERVHEQRIESLPLYVELTFEHLTEVLVKLSDVPTIPLVVGARV